MCSRCGCPTEEPVARCPDCPPRPVERARSPFLFDGPVRAALHRLKFSGWRSVAEALGASMAAVWEDPADAATWVPLSGKRLARRGYDQARALAIVVASRLQIPLVPMLRRPADTPPQARRGGVERREAVQKAFQPLPRPAGRNPPPRVLLVDDVLTTGATAAACARVLHAAGVKEVALLTAARALSGGIPARCYTRAGSRLGL
jgi:predicted amidophosphoribosyltransferase